MLRVVLEFGYVKVVVGCADQMGLRASAHPANVLNGVKRFGRFHEVLSRNPPFRKELRGKVASRHQSLVLLHIPGRAGYWKRKLRKRMMPITRAISGETIMIPTAMATSEMDASRFVTAKGSPNAAKMPKMSL